MFPLFNRNGTVSVEDDSPFPVEIEPLTIEFPECINQLSVAVDVHNVVV